MKNKSAILTVFALVVVAAIIGFVAFGGKNNTSTSDNMSSMDMSEQSSGSSQASTENPVATNEVEIEDYSFMPGAITVKVGTKVTWTNKDSVRHDVVADTESNDAPNGPLLAKGESYSFTFTKAGTYSYHCSPHPYMKGTVIVTE